ncbi:MAG: helicase [Chloroflexi bacterium]|nr:helicase [Chloroflexota bacterium]
MHKVIAFDLETRLTADQVRGWSNIRDMRLTVGATYNATEDAYHDYTKQEAKYLITNLRKADLIIGHNAFGFDYKVLRAHTDNPLSDLPTVDMLQHRHRALGWRLKLDDVAAATLGESKSANGLQAVHWFQQGQLDKAPDYCRRDTTVTWKVYEFGRQNSHIWYHNRKWRVHQLTGRW